MSSRIKLNRTGFSEVRFVWLRAGQAAVDLDGRRFRIRLDCDRPTRGGGGGGCSYAGDRVKKLITTLRGRVVRGARRRSSGVPPVPCSGRRRVAPAGWAGTRSW